MGGLDLFALEALDLGDEALDRKLTCHMIFEVLLEYRKA